MLRQLLDNAIPEDANNYLTIVSESLREIEKVFFWKVIHEKSKWFWIPLYHISDKAWDRFIVEFQVVKKLQAGEKRWIEVEEKMIHDLETLRDKMYKSPKTDTKDIILSLILGPLKQSLEKLRYIIE